MDYNIKQEPQENEVIDVAEGADYEDYKKTRGRKRSAKKNGMQLEDGKDCKRNYKNIKSQAKRNKKVIQCCPYIFF